VEIGCDTSTCDTRDNLCENTVLDTSCDGCPTIETDKSCGALCGGCDDGQHCENNSDCTSGLCKNQGGGTCGACTDDSNCQEGTLCGDGDCQASPGVERRPFAIDMEIDNRNIFQLDFTVDYSRFTNVCFRDTTVTCASNSDCNEGDLDLGSCVRSELPGVADDKNGNCRVEVGELKRTVSVDSSKDHVTIGIISLQGVDKQRVARCCFSGGASFTDPPKTLPLFGSVVAKDIAGRNIKVEVTNKVVNPGGDDLCP